MADDLIPGPLARRIVTGLDEATGKAKVLYDDTKGHVSSAGGNLFQNPWWTDEAPADCSPSTNEDPTMGPKTFGTMNEGSVCQMAWIKPRTRYPMHKTKSIDYVILLEGELELELDGGDKRLIKPGDVIVQRETSHMWYNPHPTQFAKIFAVLIASKSAIVGELTK